MCQIFASLRPYLSVAERVSNFQFAQYLSVAEILAAYLSVAERVSNFRFAQAIFERRRTSVKLSNRQICQGTKHSFSRKAHPLSLFHFLVNIVFYKAANFTEYCISNV